MSASEDMDMSESYFDDSMSQETLDPQPPLPQTKEPIKIRKKPGRKPNPASPALRKAQNRAAQRAFRERKERHMRDLEATIKQVREQREKAYGDNEHLKSENEVLKCENWYLKGIVLTLQLVCYQNNLVIPQHSPHINDQCLGVLAQSSSAPIAAYVKLNANNKLPIVPKFLGLHNRKQRDGCLSSGSIIITQDGVHPQKEHIKSTNSSAWKDFIHSSVHRNPITHPHHNSEAHENPSFSNLPDLSPVSVPESPASLHGDSNMYTSPVEATEPHIEPYLAHPTKLPNEPLTSNLAAIQTLRLRLRLQSACISMKSIPFAIQPTLLQLTVPHDPRIDLIPTPHMRDRMILFQHQFDLDDCFRCLLGSSVFHGDDPAIAGNWELPQEFFDKFWFLTIDYDLRRTTNRWRRLQGLKDLETFDNPVDSHTPHASSIYPPRTDTSNLTNTLQSQGPMMINDLSSFLGIDFRSLTQPSKPDPQMESSLDSSRSSISTDSSKTNQSQSMTSERISSDTTPPTLTPIRLTNGYAGYSPYAQAPPILKQHQPQSHQNQYIHNNPSHSLPILQNFGSWEAFIREPNEYGINLPDFTLDDQLNHT